MKYNNVKVVSHPRAGSHYLAKLLQRNFYPDRPYLDLYAGHGHHHRKWLDEPNTFVLYIYRNTDATLKSMWNMRDRLGLRADSFEEFCTTKMSRMKVPVGGRCSAIYTDGTKEEEVCETDVFLGAFDLAPEDFLTYHRKTWLDLGRDRENFLAISYDALTQNLYSVMNYIGEKLGFPVSDIKGIPQRVGWYDPSRPGGEYESKWKV